MVMDRFYTIGGSIFMINDNKEESLNVFSNDAIVGKPFLDIDRVIQEDEHTIKNTGKKENLS
jgi:hypothetical protein